VTSINIKGNFVILIVCILGVAGVVFAISWAAAWLWNITLPYLFGLPYVEWWHMLALVILIGLLTSSVRSKK